MIASGGFPPDFVWGSATASYQVEGAVEEGGRGRSIWDTFCDVPGAIRDGSSGATTCDHYHRYPADVVLMRDFGLKAYRFSIAWPRIQPAGRGPVNRRGIDHYRRVVAALRDNGIVPFVTLYHWDLPQALQDDGGWPHRDTAYRFADYVEHVIDELGSEVDQWITVNEPMVSANAGYGNGIHAPGIRDHNAAFAATHHLLLGHGLAVERLCAAAAPQSRIGIALNQTVADPASDAPSDVAAARRVDGNNNRMYLDPVLLGRYPEDMMRWLRDRVDVAVVADGDLEVIHRPIDFLGVNYYRRSLVRAVAHGETPEGFLDAEVVVPDDASVTALNWPVQPDGLRDLLVHIRDAYPTAPPLLVTENGAAFDEVVTDGAVDDPQRVAYLRAHITAVREAIDKGVDVRGYFVWSLLDNFEWAEGYTARFGIVYVDFATQQRIPKSSARWLRDFLAEANGAQS